MQIAVKNSAVANDQIPIFLLLSRDSKKFSSKDINTIKAKLSSLKLMNQIGMMTPLTELVTIVPKKSNPMIMSKNLHKMTNVMAETDMVSQVYPLMDARNTILETFSEKYNIEKIGLFNLRLTDKTSKDVYEIIWDGEMEVTLDTFVELGAAFILALVLIFFTHGCLLQRAIHLAASSFRLILIHYRCNCRALHHGFIYKRYLFLDCNITYWLYCTNRDKLKKFSTTHRFYGSYER